PRGTSPPPPRDLPVVPPAIETTAAGREVPSLDPPDDRLPDAGQLTDLRNAETRLAARLRQGITNAHAAPPSIDSTAGRRGDAAAVASYLGPRCTGAVTKCRHARDQGRGHRATSVFLRAPQRRQQTGQILLADQHVPGLGAFARADDPPALQQVHEPTGLREAHPQLALQHRGGPELRVDHLFGGQEQQVEVVTDVRVDLAGLALGG